MPHTASHFNVNNMAELMSSADIGIGASGTSTWERCCLGLPSLVMILADNQKEIAEELAKEDVSVEVIDLRTVRPIDYATIINSVKKTNRCVIVEEAWPLAAISSELTYNIQRHAFDYLDAPVIRVNSLDLPLPYAPTLIEAILPSLKRTLEAVDSVMYKR